MLQAKGRRRPDCDADDQQGSDEHHFLEDCSVCDVMVMGEAPLLLFDCLLCVWCAARSEGLFSNSGDSTYKQVNRSDPPSLLLKRDSIVRVRIIASSTSDVLATRQSRQVSSGGKAICVEASRDADTPLRRQ